MSLAVDDEFGGFVAARWPDLEAVALVAADDPATARELTTEALARLGRRWDEAVEEGSPTRAARAELLQGLARLGGGPSPVADREPSPVATPRPERAAEPVAEPVAERVAEPVAGPDAGGTDDDVIHAALLAAVRDEPPLVRAALAASTMWGCDAVDTAGLAGQPARPLADRVTAAHGRLLTAHRAALAARGHSAADWRLEGDLADALERLAAATLDPPDPAALVEARSRGVHRRALLLGGTGALAAGGAAWWLLRGAAHEPPLTATSRPGAATATAVGPQDPVWASTSQWPARGALAADPGILAMVAAEGGWASRLLWADDVAGLRVAVVARLDQPNMLGASTVLTVWAGAEGAPAGALAPVPLTLDRTDGVADVVAVSVPIPPSIRVRTVRMTVVRADSEPGGPAPVGPGAADAGAPVAAAAGAGAAVLVLLTRPTVAVATWSPVVHPTENGSVERTWTLVRLDGGVGAQVVDHVPGAAARVQCGDYDGPLAGVASTSPSTDGLTPEDAATVLVATATGVPADDLRSTVVIDSPVAGSVLDASAISASDGDGRVRVVHTTTPDGALVRTLHVADDGRSGRSALFGPPVVLPAAEAGSPIVRRLDLVPPRTTRYLVVATGATTCQLLATAPAAYPVSKVERMFGQTAVVPIVNGQDTNSYRLVLWDTQGGRRYSAVPPRGRPLLDLGPWY